METKLNINMNSQPNLFMIGAPKCGTSSLSTWLSGHSDVFMPSIKEPHYYNTDEGHRIYDSRDSYLDLYSDASDYKYRLDASTWYLHSQQAIKNILKDCPDAKFIVCLRNPVDMAFSLHNHYVNRSSRENVTSFSAAWALADERLMRQAKNSLMTEPRHLAYKYSCRLGSQCERLLQQVSTSQVHFIIFDYLVESPESTLTSLLDFLELPLNIHYALPHQNKAIKRRSLMLNKTVRLLSRMKHKMGVDISLKFLTERIERFNSINHKYSIDPGMKEAVTDYFSVEIDKISKITGHDLEHWKNHE